MEQSTGLERSESTSSSSDFGTVVLVNPDSQEWRPVLQVSNQVVLYHPTSHALTIRQTPTRFPSPRPCPYCKQKLPHGFEPDPAIEDRFSPINHDGSIAVSDPAYHSRASDYFRLLAVANETSSRPSTPPLPSPRRNSSEGRRRSSSAFPAETMAEGYFKAFFQEEYKLGMGANGSVFLCQHVLDGNPLGHFAVKKIAVGESHSYLLTILREVRLLERLHHPNIITYHHAWLESCQFSAFGPKVPTLHVLMQWAEGGSLDDLIDARLGRPTKYIFMDPMAPFIATTDLAGATLASASPATEGPTSNDAQARGRGGHGNGIANGASPSRPTVAHQNSGYDIHSRSARIKAFRAMQKASPSERERMRREMEEVRGSSVGGMGRPSWKAVHLLSAEEVKSLFKDVVEGLAFLHDKSILHLDLKPGNVLLTWDEGKLIPRAMLSDFGTSRDRLSSARIRSGNTGTLEYASPESLPTPTTHTLNQVDSKADMWSLGMILHKLLFFKLPYRYAADGDAAGGGENGVGGAGVGMSGRMDEADKLDRLEKEVLDYPGFKASPALATTFEARRLPRSFLVLLEGLLNVVPSSRPSCERVSAAIKSGKFDPLEEHEINQSPTEGSLIPIRRTSDPHVPTSPSLSASTQVQSNTVASVSVQGQTAAIAATTAVIATRGERMKSPARAVPSLPAPPIPAGAEQRNAEVDLMPRRSPVLSLPAPRPEDSVEPDVKADADTGVSEKGGLWQSLSGTRRGGVGQRRHVQRRGGGLVRKLKCPDWRDGAFWARTLKSCILAVKVMTISRLCSTTEQDNGSGPHSLAVALLTLVAISDTWFEELWVTFVLLLVHVVAVKYGCVVGLGLGCCS